MANHRESYIITLKNTFHRLSFRNNLLGIQTNCLERNKYIRKQYKSYFYVEASLFNRSSNSEAKKTN